jgi:hypothetical protein
MYLQSVQNGCEFLLMKMVAQGVGAPQGAKGVGRVGGEQVKQYSTISTLNQLISVGRMCGGVP